MALINHTSKFIFLDRVKAKGEGELAEEQIMQRHWQHALRYPGHGREAD